MVADRYRLVEQLGAGGNGVVWRANDRRLRRDVALKRAGFGGDRQVELLRREGIVAAGFHHPNVVTLLDVLADGDELWLVMEYVPARSLAELLADDGTVDAQVAIAIGVQVARALEAVHAKGVVHRDIKPSNILVAADRTVKVTDFGVSRAVWSEPTLTGDALVVGTPGYLAPEVARGERVTAAADIFSLGATLYAAVEGSVPYVPADTPQEALRSVCEQDMRPTRRAGPLGDVLVQLLARDVAKRPDAARTRQLLEALQGIEPPVAPKPRRRRLALIGAAAAVAVATVAGGTAYALTRHPTQQATAVGDPHTADPCGLVQPAGLSRFGRTELRTAYGGFERCDVLVRPETADETDVEVAFAAPSGGMRPAGRLPVLRPPPDSDGCGRTILLADADVEIIAKQNAQQQRRDYCQLADAATSFALGKLATGVPRRTATYPRDSLFYLKACSLLNGSALARLPGVDAGDPDAGFAGWQCRWHSITDDVYLDVAFDRNLPLTSTDGKVSRMSGREVYVAATEDSCRARVAYREFRDERGERLVELVKVTLAGRLGSGERLCPLVTDLTRALVQQLPAS